MTNNSKKHAMESLVQRAARGEISRRQFAQLSALVLAGTPMLLRSSDVFAQATELVLLNWVFYAISSYESD